MVQSTVYRAARYTAAVCNLLHRYHKITLLRYLYLYYITYPPVHQMLHVHENDVPYISRYYNDSGIFVRYIYKHPAIYVHIHEIMHGQMIVRPSYCNRNLLCYPVIVK